MRMILALCAISLISLSGCTSNVVPQKGQTMEQIYDSIGKKNNEEIAETEWNEKARAMSLHEETEGMSVRAISSNSVNSDFRKLSNPELKVYVFPHLAGMDDVPIPGYYTVFNVYEHDHYIPQQWS